MPLALHLPHPQPQAFSAAALDNKIAAKIAGLPDIVQELTRQTTDLGKDPETVAAAAVPVANTAGIIAGTVVGFGIAFGLVVLGLVVLRQRRLAASGESPAKRYAVSGDNNNDMASPAGAGPVAEASEYAVAARSYYQRRTLRAKAALQQLESPERSAKSK